MAEYVLGYRDLKGSHGDGFTCTDGDPDLLLRSSAEYGDSHRVQEAIDKGGHVNSRNELTGMSALILASLGGHTEVVALLLRHGADINIQCANGNTALMLASYRGHEKVIKMLRKHAVDFDGNPLRPTQASLRTGRVELPAGGRYAVERELVNEHGRNARELAVDNGFNDAAQLV